MIGINVINICNDSRTPISQAVFLLLQIEEALDPVPFTRGTSRGRLTTYCLAEDRPVSEWAASNRLTRWAESQRCQLETNQSPAELLLLRHCDQGLEVTSYELQTAERCSTTQTLCSEEKNPPLSWMAGVIRTPRHSENLPH